MMGFLFAWICLGFYAILARPRMIWEEPERNYRVTLAFICAPACLFTNVMIVLWVGGTRAYWFLRDSVDGVNPLERDKKEAQQ